MRKNERFDIIFCEDAIENIYELDGFPVYTFNKLLKLKNISDSLAFITGRNSKTIYYMMEKFEELGINEIGIVKYRAYKWNC